MNPDKPRRKNPPVPKPTPTPEKQPGRSLKWLQPVIHALDYLFIFRPTLFFMLWTVVLIGLAGYHFTSGESIWWQVSVDWGNVLNIVMISLLFGSIFIFNQLKDITSDHINRKVFIISEGHVTAERARWIGYVAMVAPLVYFLLVNRYLLIIGLALLLVGYIYNGYWKNQPGVDALGNILFGVLLYLFGWGLNALPGRPAVRHLVPYIFICGAFFLLTTIPDMKGDAAVNKRTFAVAFGIKITIWVAAACQLLGFLAGLLIRDPLVTHPTLLSLPLFGVIVFQSNQAWVLRTIRYTLLFYAGFICVLFPWYFVVICVNFFLSKMYYRHRFGLDYPTFQVEDAIDDPDRSGQM